MNTDDISVTIYGTPQCGYCTKAKEFCEDIGVSYNYLEVGSDITPQQLFDKVGKPVRTVPQVFLTKGANESHLGGYDALVSSLGGTQ